MKRNHMIATLAILIGMGVITVSCEKEQASKSHKAEIITDAPMKTGEDDEDPVIQGRVRKKRGLAPIDSAYVETVFNPTRIPVKSSYTDNLGQFTHQVAAGTYFFRVTVPGTTTPYETDTIHVSADTILTILID